MRRLIASFVFIAALLAGQFIDSGRPDNAPRQRNQPYVLLISIDAFRYDYADRFGARNLIALRESGASAKSLIPPFPSLTFPSHYTIATGLYPEHHGLVGMFFYDPRTRERFAFNDPRDSSDGTWYGGTPLWVLAEQQGMRSASVFWVGSEAEIQGVRPSFYTPYDDKISHAQRVDKILEWLRLPPEKRPHFLTLYFSEVDHAGHRDGPLAPATREAVRHVDRGIGRLMEGLRKLPFRVDLVVVSDHGMIKLGADDIELWRYADLTGFETDSFSGPHLMLYSKDRELVQRTYAALKGKSPRFEVYRKNEVPRRLHFSSSERIGDLVVIPTEPVFVVARERQLRPGATPRPRYLGMHGYDPYRFPEMHGIFYAAGPHIRGRRIDSFESVHVYPFIAGILGLKTPSGLDAPAKALDKLRRP